MIHELKQTESQKARALFTPLSFHASCAAVLGGTNPGRIFVDDPLCPTAGFVLSPEAAYLSGDADNREFCRSLGSYLRDATNLGVAVWHLQFIVSSDCWRQRLNEIAGESKVVATSRRHFLCSAEEDLPTMPPPKDTVLRPIDEDLLNADAIALPDHIGRWIHNNWGSCAHFLSAGFGVVAICRTEIVSWSVADCRAGNTCEIGVRTAPEWRQRGMGSFTASGAARHAFCSGLQSVGWHCPEQNVASQRTALRAGFTLERKYNTYTICEPKAGGDA